MFHFTRYRAHCAMYSHSGDRALPRPGYPIRKSTGRSVFAALRGLSQLITSFIACWHQGIHHVLLVAFYHLDITEISPRRTFAALAAGSAQTQFCQLFGSCNFSSLICECQRTAPWAMPRDLIQSELLRPLSEKFKTRKRGVGLIGLEPMTLRLSSACSNQLSYRPEGGPAVRNVKFLI